MKWSNFLICQSDYESSCQRNKQIHNSGAKANVKNVNFLGLKAFNATQHKFVGILLSWMHCVRKVIHREGSKMKGECIGNHTAGQNVIISTSKMLARSMKCSKKS